MNADVTISASWDRVVGEQFDQPYMTQLRQFLLEQKQQKQVVFPPSSLVFNALRRTPFDDVRVVILGQDPYHGPDQAHGLSFSVPRGVPPPPSLVNIFKEIEADLGIETPSHGCLEHWADQGVLLLNAVLTVRRSEAGSHQGQGWEQFTDAVIDALNKGRRGLVFLLWGSNAQRKGELIDASRHLVLKAPHPSPLSAHRGFMGCGHFSLANDYLASQGQVPVDWSLGMETAAEKPNS